MKHLEIPFFAEKKELFDFLVTNKTTLIAQKKGTLKQADGIPFNNTFFDHKEKAFKSNKPVSLDLDPLMVKAAINTTNVIDSHLDLHIPKMWNRSLKNNGKDMLHLQEHEMKFASIISDGNDLKAYVQTSTWLDLGFKFPGATEVLTFESTIRKDRNPYMHKEYALGRVKNHSVSMRYIQLVMCINDKDYGAEFEAYEKYIKMAVNPEVAEETGYFWAVPEAACIEGSAVPKGSNVYTPTISNNMNENKSEAVKGIDFGYLSANFKL